MLRRSLLQSLLAMTFPKQTAGFQNPGPVVASSVTVFGPNRQVLVYSPTRGAGNLIGSVSSVQTTDKYGNIILQGITTYTPGAGPIQAAQIVNGTLQLLTAATQAGPYTLQQNVGFFAADMQINSVTNNIQLFAGFGKQIIASNPLNMADPNASAGVAETWHNLGAPIAGWTVNTARYKLLPGGLVAVQFINVGVPAAKPADNTTIWTAANGLPSQYQPPNAPRLPSYFNGAIAGEMPAWEFETDGSIHVYGLAGTTVTRMDGFFIFSIT